MTTSTHSLGLSSRSAVAAAHFDLVWGWLILFFFPLEAAVFFFQACSRHYKRDVRSTFQIDRERVDLLASFVFVFVSGCGEVEYCTFSTVEL